MTDTRIVRFYLEEGLRASAQAGQHNFINKVTDVLRTHGFEVVYCKMSERGGGGYAMTHMKPAESGNGLTFRRVYHYPFWQIDSTDKRWNWRVAKAQFDPIQINETEAQRFYNFWRKRLFGLKDACGNDGFVYVPLQGKLTQHRSFQSCSPVQMIERVLDIMPHQKVIATLHPKEDYLELEQAELERLENKFQNLELRVGQMQDLLANCACIVTQNSSAAFNGYFYGKPTALFGKVDFHHIALDGLSVQSYDDLVQHAPDYARYIWWFWQNQSINAGHPSAEQKIEDRFRTFGWIS